MGSCLQDLKRVHLVYLLAQCRWYRLAWLRAKRNWVCAELNEGDGKREGLELRVIMLKAKKKSLKRRYGVWLN